MITWVDVVNVASRLAMVPVATQAAILVAVDLLCECDTFENKCDLAKTYLAAHLGELYLQGGSGQALTVVSEKVGDVSRTFALPANWRDTLDTTQYGLTYKMILDRTLNAHLPLVC